MKLNINFIIYFTDDSLAHLAGIFHNLYLKVQEIEEIHYQVIKNLLSLMDENKKGPNFINFIPLFCSVIPAGNSTSETGPIT